MLMKRVKVITPTELSRFMVGARADILEMPGIEVPAGAEYF